MIRLTVEETNLLSIYNEGGKRGLMENINAALPFMDEDMRELAKRTLAKIAPLYFTGRRGGMCLPAAYFLFSSMQMVSDRRTSL